MRNDWRIEYKRRMKCGKKPHKSRNVFKLNSTSYSSYSHEIVLLLTFFLDLLHSSPVLTLLFVLRRLIIFAQGVDVDDLVLRPSRKLKFFQCFLIKQKDDITRISIAPWETWRISKIESDFSYVNSQRFDWSDQSDRNNTNSRRQKGI